jgi:hypothetical protein
MSSETIVIDDDEMRNAPIVEKSKFDGMPPVSGHSIIWKNRFVIGADK